MAEVKWIKVSVGLFDNRKIKMIQSMPDGYAIIVAWLKLLCLAGQVNDGGAVYFTEEIPYTEQMLSSQFGMPLATIQLALNTFEQFGMIEIIDNILRISNWEKYQNEEQLQKIREQTRERVARYRENKRLESCNATVALQERYSNATEEDIEEDKEKEEEKDNYIVQQVGRDRFKPHQLETEFETLWKEYPRKEGKQKAFTAYQRARRDGASFEEVFEGIKRYKEQIRAKGTSPEYIAMCQTWFNQKRWQDEYEHESHGGYESNEFFKMAMEAGLKGE